MNTVDVTCVRCGSDDTKSFEMAHAMGTTSGSVNSTTRQFGEFKARTSGTTTQATALAIRVTPPELPSSYYAEYLSIAVVLGLITGKALTALIENLASPETMNGFTLFIYVGIVGATMFYAYSRARKNEVAAMTLHAEAMREWKRRWICLRCGYEWQHG